MSVQPWVVVIAEDDLLIREVITYVLIDEGFDVIQTDRGENALKVILDRGLNVDLLFTDVRMPGAFDGFELARRARLLVPHLGILIASGHARPALGDMPVGSRFLPKPYRISEMTSFIQSLLPKRIRSRLPQATDNKPN